MLSLGLRGIQGRVPESYLAFVFLPKQAHKSMVVCVPAGEGDDGSGMLRSRTVLLDDSGQMWLKYSRQSVNQPPRIEKLDSMFRSLADWRATEILQEVVARVAATSDAQQVRRLMTSDKDWD